MDFSYTRTQHGNVGITRTVRRLFMGLQGNSDCVPVVFHRAGYRSLHLEGTAPEESGMDRDDSAAARIFRWLNSGKARRLASLLPANLLRWAWTFNNKLTFNALSASEVPITFKRGDYLVLADESWNYSAWIGAQQARAQGASVVLVLYDLIPLRHPEFCAPLFTDVFRRWLLRMLSSCDAVICISATTEADLVRWCAEQGLPTPRTGHFRLGSDLPREDGGHVRDRLAQFMRSEVPFFAAIGTIEPRKNYKFLLKVFEQFWSQGEQVRLLIAGRPHPECKKFIKEMEQHPQQGRLLVTLQDASDAELARIYAECRSLLFPSLAEGFGLPLVEARSRGCPVIASDLSSLNELADGGVFMFRTGSEEELIVLLRDHLQHDYRPKIGTMPMFTWNDSANEFFHVMERLKNIKWKV